MANGVRRRTVLKGLGLGALGSLALGGYAFAIEPLYRLSVTRYTVRHEHWNGKKPLKIIALADIHFCEPWMTADRVREIVRQANALEPDLIVLLGDYAPGIYKFRGSLVPRDDWVSAISGLSAPLGVHGVLGNHDWWNGGEFYRDGMIEAGVKMHINNAVKLSDASGGFWLAGTDSIMAAKLPGGGYKDQSDLPMTLSKVTDDAPIILMAHEPDQFTHVPERVALTLSGHTHGGQVRLPIFGAVFVPSEYGQEYAYGHIVKGKKQLIVSGGLGCSILPVRFGVPPEVVEITIKGQEM